MDRRGVICCLVSAVLFGAAAPLASLLVQDMAPLALAGLLYLGAAVAVTPLVARRPWPGAALRRAWRPVAGAVLAGGAIGPALLMAGLARTDAATASILLNLELVATVVLAATFFREHLGRRVVGGAALVAVGGVVLVWQPDLALSTGAVLIAGACIAWGIDNCITARIDQITPEHVVLIKGIVAGTVNLALGVAVAGGPSPAGVVVGAVAGAIAVGALGYGVSISLWVRGARYLGAARGQIIFASAPFIGAAIGWLALHEPTTPRQLLAVAFAVAGVGLSLETAHEHRHRHDAVDHDHEHTHDDEHHDHAHDDDFAGRHAHRHRHRQLVHAHPHTPDLHHRHEHR